MIYGLIAIVTIGACLSIDNIYNGVTPSIRFISKIELALQLAILLLLLVELINV